MKKKVALITGGAKGIGRACAEALAKEGYQIALHYRSNPELANEVTQSLGPDAKAYAYDLSDEKACQDLVKQVQDDMGSIDLLVNNAGVAIDQLIIFAKPADFESILSSNLKPVFWLTKLVSRGMARKKVGCIINMTSVVGHTGNAGQSMYAATKSAITGFTKSIAQDLAPFGIRCNCVAPGFIETNMTDSLPDNVREQFLKKIPLARLGSPKEVADVVVFLASEKASYITATTIHVNGGMYAS